MNEVWKDIKGFEGKYQVSNLGRVKSLNYARRGYPKILKPNSNHTYSFVNLSKNDIGKSYSIHRLVAEAFLDNPQNLPMVNHKDENRFNNRVDNLEWCTASYNINYGTRSEKVTHSLGKRVLCVETGIIYQSQGDAARKTGLSQQNISMCCRKEYRTIGGFHWRFV